MENILVSVVVTTYNARKLLEGVLNSLIKQEFNSEEYEIIVVNDGSEDDTTFFLKNWTKGKDNTRYVNQRNKGVAGARNTGIRLARGKIVAFTDQDCIADKNWLKEIVKPFSNSEIIGVSGCTVSEFKKITPFTHQVVDKEGKDFPTCNVAYRKDILEKVNGFNETFKYGYDDTDIYLRSLKFGKIINNSSAIICHLPIQYSFLKFIKRMRVEFIGQMNFCKEYPAIFKERNPIITTIWFRGVLEFFRKLNIHKYWILKNPFVYGEYVLALILQRYYLLWLCIIDRK